MKRKNSDRHMRRWLLRIGAAFFLILTLIPVVLLSYKLGTLQHASTNAGPMEAVMDGNNPFVHAPAYTVLQEIKHADPFGTLILAGWIERKGTKCLGVLTAKQNHRIDKTHAFHGSIKECNLGRYSIDQFWTGKLWDSKPYSFAYGYSGDAQSVVVTWQDNAVMPLTPVNGTYTAIHEARWLAIRSVDFFDADGGLIYRLPDAIRPDTASRRAGS